MNDRRLGELVERVVAGVAAVASESVHCRRTGAAVFVFANRFSGLMMNGTRLHRLESALPNETAGQSYIIAPEGREDIPGALADLVAAIGRALAASPGGVLLVSVGGDGTHKSVLSSLVELEEGLRERVSVYRFPAGSSNDGPATPHPLDALRRLGAATENVSVKALEVETAKGKRELGFNIVSLGIDAYTTLKNEQFRNVLGGNAYRGLANVAVLFYNVLHDPGEPLLQIENGTGEVREVRRRLVLIAMGASGNRTYGGGIPVLPDDNNLCYVEHLGLYGKISLKGRLMRGTHVKHSKVQGGAAATIALTVARPIPLQIDGEARWVEADETPLRVRLRREHIRELV